MKSDKDIQRDVRQELAWNPAVTETHVGVSVEDGVVTLSGKVPSYAEKAAAEASAMRVDGVKAIVEKIEVEIPGTFHRSDADIARAAIDALKWNVQIPSEKIQVSVENGRVELSGEVPWEFQKRASYDAVRNLTGVTWVDNAITVKSRINPENVKEKIEQALKRAAEREANRILIEAEGGRVTLSGKVRSLADLRDAEGAAWSAPGVSEVVSNLKVA